MSPQVSKHSKPSKRSRGTSRDGHIGSESVEEIVPELTARVKQMVKSGKSHVTAWRDDLQDGFRVKPIQSVLIAAAVGAVIGLVFGRRRA